MRHVRIYSIHIMLKQKQCVIAVTKVFAWRAHEREFFVRKELEWWMGIWRMTRKYFFARNESDRGEDRIVERILKSNFKKWIKQKLAMKIWLETKGMREIGRRRVFRRWWTENESEANEKNERKRSELLTHVEVNGVHPSVRWCSSGGSPSSPPFLLNPIFNENSSR